MIDPKKVQALSRKELFEQNTGRQAFKVKEYCEDLPVWKGFSRSAVAGLILSLMFLVLVVLAAPDLTGHLRRSVGDVWMTVILALGLAVFTAVYSIISDVFFRRYYTGIRSTLCGYKSVTARLEKMRRDQETL